MRDIDKIGVDRVASRKAFYGVVFIIFLMFLTVVLANFAARKDCSLENKPKPPAPLPKTPFESLSENISPDNIKYFLRTFTAKPHIAGSENQHNVAHAIESLWKSFGLQDVRQIPYEVLLTYPVWKEPNTLSIIDQSSNLIYEHKIVEPTVIKEEQSDKYAGVGFLAWSAPGNVSGDVVFCNRGFIDDFEHLEDIGISVKGKIALIRYGKLFRGNKVLNAQKYGAIGVVLYSDPSDVAGQILDGDEHYPNSIWMPRDGLQRGFILKSVSGDPLTPLYPSKPGIYRSQTLEKLRELNEMPIIPAVSIGYGAAYEIISRLNGPKVPFNWQGGLNVTYRFGSTLENYAKLMLSVRATFETKTINNVIGYIRGKDDPDRYVILGNHFDAWVYGSLDPNSGTAIMAELARALMQTINETGWRPSRSIMFANWDAEEYGLIGSTEFAEEFGQNLMQRAVAYINMDCLEGNLTLKAAAVPSLYDVTIDVTKAVKNPNRREQALGRKRVFDSWLRYHPQNGTEERPKFSIPNGGTDHAPFLHFLTIPTIDFTFENPQTGYPLYHSMYETPFLNEQLLDKLNFSVHKATGQLWANFALRFADDKILPINVTRIASTMTDIYLPKLQNTIKGYIEDAPEHLKDTFDQLEKLEEACTVLFRQSKNFYAILGRASPARLRIINDHLMSIERCFFLSGGVPGRPDNRHVIYSMDPKNRYYAREFGPIYDLIHEALDASSGELSAKFDREIAQQLSMVQHALRCASSMLRDFI